MRLGRDEKKVRWKRRKFFLSYLALRRSYKVVESTRSTTTRSIQLRGNKSQACQSIIHPPSLTSSSMTSSSYTFNFFTEVSGEEEGEGDEQQRQQEFAKWRAVFLPCLRRQSSFGTRRPSLHDILYLLQSDLQKRVADPSSRQGSRCASSCPPRVYR